jgi:hypothetical protein
MIQHIVLITFKDDVDASQVDEFLAATDEIFADTPFRSVVHGQGIGAVPNGADWAYSGVLDSNDISLWREHPSHIRLRDHVTPMTASVKHIQLVLES